MLEQWKGSYRYGYGIEPMLEAPVVTEHYTLYPGLFPQALPQGVKGDVIVLLAVMEHLKPEEQRAMAQAAYELLNPGGRIVITVPSPRVDDILHLAEKLHLIDGMSVHEHYGFQPEDTLTVFEAPRFNLVQRRRFQLGLNNLYVFEKASGTETPEAALSGTQLAE